jgi:hypothetical protein
MLKPSKKAGGSPLLTEGPAHGASAPKTVPNRPGSAKNRTLLDEASAGSSKKGTFRAPRSEGSSDAACCGYTKVG